MAETPYDGDVWNCKTPPFPLFGSPPPRPRTQRIYGRHPKSPINSNPPSNLNGMSIDMKDEEPYKESLIPLPASHSPSRASPVDSEGKEHTYEQIPTSPHTPEDRVSYVFITDKAEADYQEPSLAPHLIDPRGHPRISKHSRTSRSMPADTEGEERPYEQSPHTPSPLNLVDYNGEGSPCARRRVVRPNRNVVGSDVYRTPRHQPKSSPAKDTPIMRKRDGLKGAFLPNKAKDIYVQAADEARKFLIGPMPVNAFLDAFLPHEGEDKAMPNPAGAFNGVPPRPAKEEEIYGPLMTAIKKGRFCPNVEFRDTSVNSEDKGRGACKPDIIGFDKADVGRLKQVKQTRKVHANLGLAEITIEVKTSVDPFCDDHDHADPLRKSFFAFDNRVIRSSEQAIEEKKVFGQVVVYASEQCARQHRAFCFVVLVIGTKARLFRFDRAGIIVTEAFDYVTDPVPLCTFLWRFNHASPAERGFDPTVTVASPDEEQVFRKVISEEVAFQLGIDVTSPSLKEKLRFHYEEGKVTKVMVYDEIRSEWDFYLVSVPVTSPKSSAGRCTRGYWSVGLTGPYENKVGFLKDTWRVDMDGVALEGLTYEEMSQNGVVNISGLHGYGDVVNDEDDESDIHDMPDVSFQTTSDESSVAEEHLATPPPQCTRTQDFIEEEWVCPCFAMTPRGKKKDLRSRVFKHTHSRLVLDTVGYPLKEFTGSQELFEAARDALEALISAYVKCKRLHRDVSLGNIILVRREKMGRRRGVLIDWEFSTKVDRRGRASDYFRSGTWAYMSASCLDPREDFRHSITDDLESLLYVVLYGCVRWVPHNPVEDLGEWMHRFFDSATTSDGRDIGGDTKARHYTDCDKFGKKFQFTSDCINNWFANVYQHLGTRAPNLLNRGLEMTFTPDNFLKELDIVCNGLRITAGTDNDKTDHPVVDYYDEEKTELRATHITSLMSMSHRTGDISAVLDNRGSKRSLYEDRSADEPRVRVVEPVNKRSRVDGDAGRSTANDEDGTERQSVMKNVSKWFSSRSSGRNSRVLSDASSRANLQRLRFRRKSNNSLKSSSERRSTRLAGKNSSSSLKGPARSVRSFDDGMK